MLGQMSLFEDKKEQSTDWKWSMAKDYPKKNGLKVFSCFACGGGLLWDTNSVVVKFLAAMKLTHK